MLIYSMSVSVDGFIVFSHTLDSVQGNARLAEASLAEEIAAALDATDTPFLPPVTEDVSLDLIDTRELGGVALR